MSSTRAVLDSMAEQINSLGAEARRLVERMDAESYRIVPKEVVDRSPGMRNVKGNARERRSLVYIVEREENGNWYDVGFQFKTRDAAKTYIQKAQART